MLHKRKITILALRWLVVGVLLAILASAIWIAEDKIDQMTKSICPQGWWHTSEFWAHCAYAPISVSKYGAMYGGFAGVALLLIHAAAPAPKELASRILLFALMLPPAYQLLFVQFSWVEIAKLAAVAVVALIFGLSKSILNRKVP